MSEILCKYCDKELSEEKGELAHGCLDCHYDPRADKIDLLNRRLKEAEEVIAYYANYSTWMVSTQPDLFDSVKSEDLEACQGIFNNPEQDIGGKRARSYQQKYLTAHIQPRRHE